MMVSGSTFPCGPECLPHKAARSLDQVCSSGCTLFYVLCVSRHQTGRASHCMRCG